MKLVRVLLTRSIPVVAVVSGLACGSPAAVESPPVVAARTAPVCDPACGATLAQARDEHRAMDAEQRASEAAGQCELTQHQLDSLRQRDVFQDVIFYRLTQAAISEKALRARMAGVSGKARRDLEATLASARTARDAIVDALGRARKVSDLEWPRYAHDLDSATAGLDALLRDSP